MNETVTVLWYLYASLIFNDGNSYEYYTEIRKPNWGECLEAGEVWVARQEVPESARLEVNCIPKAVDLKEEWDQKHPEKKETSGN